MNISNNSKEKKLYSSKILYKAPNIYETYKRMKQNKNISFSELNTSRSSIEGINKIDYNISTKNNEKNFTFNNKNNLTDRNIQKNDKQKKVQIKPHLSYLGFLESKGFAFVSNEPRFKWQNTYNYNYPTGINTFQRTKKHFKINFDDYSKMEYEYKRQKKYIYSPSNDSSLNLTKRVLNTDENHNNNDEELIIKKNKKRKNVKKFLNVGGIMSLLKKTPLKQEFKGVKRIKRKNSYDLNLFGKDYAKFELPKTVKRHFKDKNVDNDIFGLHKFKSFDNIKPKENKSCSKYKKYIEINPVNWNIINYKNFYGKK